MAYIRVSRTHISRHVTVEEDEEACLPYVYDPTLFAGRQSMPPTPRTRSQSLLTSLRADTDKVCSVYSGIHIPALPVLVCRSLDGIFHSHTTPARVTCSADTVRRAYSDVDGRRGLCRWLPPRSLHKVLAFRRSSVVGRTLLLNWDALRPWPPLPLFGQIRAPIEIPKKGIARNEGADALPPCVGEAFTGYAAVTLRPALPSCGF